MADVVIIGGGCVGTASGLALKEAEPSLDVVIIDPDYSYEFAATGKGTGGVRQLFTRPENILMSQVTLDVIDDWENWASIDGKPAPELGWTPNGYIFIVDEADRPTLEANYARQQELGVEPVWFEREELATTFPEFVTEDMSAGVLSPRDGWLNPKVFFAVLRDKAVAAGVDFREGRVVDFETEPGSIGGADGSGNQRVTAVVLESGERIEATHIVDAAGVHAPTLAAKLGIDIPVEPMRRHEHYVHTEEDVSHLPFFKDVHGLAVHSYLDGISVGLVDFDHPGGENFEIDPGDYTDRVAPALAERFTGLGELTLEDSWTGLYDQNRFDGNMILGRHEEKAENFWFASGFSGHGFMHAIAVGRGLSELILDGEYTTLDLSNMGYQRILDNNPYGEEGVR